MSTSSDSVSVVFTPSGKRGSFTRGTSVLQAARELGVDLDSVCGGRGLCGRCQILCSTGEYAKHKITSKAEHLSASTRSEVRYQRINGAFVTGHRLGCQSQLLGDVVIDIPAESQIHRQVVRKSVDHVNVSLKPAVHLHLVEVAQPDMYEPSSDLRRLKQALGAEWDLHNLNVDLSLLHSLQKTLREGDWQVTVAIHRNSNIIALWPGFKGRIFGVAIDVGSTTIAAHLCDLVTGEVVASSGAMNPQIRFGEDLMSRVSYVMMNSGGDTEMTQSVRTAINQLLSDVAGQADIDKNDILDITFVGNPVMHHLLLGINPVELGGAPFALTTDESLYIDAASIGVHAHPKTQAYFLPCIAGHVGADTAGVILSEQPDQLAELTLLVDIGTNAEIVLGNKHKLLACSSPTGPAFEGAQISGGQRAAPGAIERVRIDRETLEPRFSIIGCDTWSDQPGFNSDSSTIGVTGICGSGIIEVIAEMFLAGIIDTDGVIQGHLAAQSPRIVAHDRTFSYELHAGAITVCITQNDVRQIQLAKAALYAGVRLLMDRFDCDHIDRIRLAGAFGSHIDVKYAMVLGLIPDCNLHAVSSAGNAAGTGALIALLNTDARGNIEQLVRVVEKIETAVEPEFQKHFIEAMAFPHKTASFSELAKTVALPQHTQSVADSRGIQRQRSARRRARRSK